MNISSVAELSPVYCCLVFSPVTSCDETFTFPVSACGILGVPFEVLDHLLLVRCVPGVEIGDVSDVRDVEHVEESDGDIRGSCLPVVLMPMLSSSSFARRRILNFFNVSTSPSEMFGTPPSVILSKESFISSHLWRTSDIESIECSKESQQHLLVDFPRNLLSSLDWNRGLPV